MTVICYNVISMQALQKVSGSSQSEIKHYISVQYPGVSKSLLRHDSADTENTLGRLKAGGYVRVRSSSVMWSFLHKMHVVAVLKL